MANYQFPPDLAQEISRRMSTGRYGSEDDVLREAFQLLRRHDEEVAAIGEGIADMEAGRIRPLKTFDAEFRQQKGISPGN